MQETVSTHARQQGFCVLFAHVGLADVGFADAGFADAGFADAGFAKDVGL